MIGLIKLGCRAVFAIGAETPSVCCGDLLIFFRRGESCSSNLETFLPEPTTLLAISG